jgi:vitamin B12 transporter
MFLTVSSWFLSKYKYEKESVLNSSFNTIQRNYNTFNSYSNSVDYSDYKSRSVNVDAFNKYSFSNQFL